MSEKKYVYHFAEGNANMKMLLGGKGANLAEMSRIGLPVPPGFIVTTEACRDFIAQGQQFPAGLKEEVQTAMKQLEGELGRCFGGENDLLLISVRSGSPVSMPGMMDTVLNLGLNDRTVEALAKDSGNETFALDCYRRLLTMFGDVVLGVEHDKFAAIYDSEKHRVGVSFDYQLTPDSLRRIINDYKDLIAAAGAHPFPQDPMEQLFMSIFAVFNSWQNDRAVIYRKLHKIPDDYGTAVNIQAMVFGNMGEGSGSGVAFSRNPSTGEKALYGEYLLNAQGEDIVAGIRTPKPISLLKEELPEIYDQFAEKSDFIEKHYKNMQDMEFTVERGKLWILQTRNGKRTAAASVRIAVNMAEEGLISKEEAIMSVDAGQLSQLLHRQIDPQAEVQVIAAGLPASPGAASGTVVFDSEQAHQMTKNGAKVILVRTETTPDDIQGIVAAQGILTSRGGMTSHAAVVARGMGKCCVCGCEAIKIDYINKVFTVDDLTIKEGDTISIDGTQGHVVLGEVPMVEPELSPEFMQLSKWADDIRTLSVRANADNPADAARAIELGATGIGLCRTEHMFMDPQRLPLVQAMILAENAAQRQEALGKLLPVQQQDFYDIFKTMDGLPVTMRLLDPPLHEFLPDATKLAVEICTMEFTKAPQSEIDEKKRLLDIIETLAERNPMLGNRGCRLGITFPEIYEMQAEAIFHAAAQLCKEGCCPVPEIEIPLISDNRELTYIRKLILRAKDKVEKETGIVVECKIGVMIELPRAALIADELAVQADFFCFGTNDLTQATLGFSRDDAEGTFMPAYLEKKIFIESPFIVIDRTGVGKLMQMAVDNGRSVKPDLLIGICGEQGGEPGSIEFCHLTGLDYVSCSPFRIPIARIAAAQAKIKHEHDIEGDFNTH